MSEKGELKNNIDRSFRDPIAAILLKNSHITTVQYESLIIDYVSEYISDKELTYEDKAFLRSKNVSRGSFSRTLAQARRNIISSIYTILLLYYIGVFDAPPFEDYRSLAEKMREYLAVVQVSDEPQAKQLLKRIREELMKGIQALAEPKSLKFV